MQGRPIFLRSWLIRLRSVTADHFAVFHPGSGALFATDRLGDLALGRLMAGASIPAVARWLDTVAPGAGARLALLEDALAALGALSETAPTRGARWWLRHCAGQAIRLVVGLCSVVAPHLPLGALAALFRWLPRAVLARRMLGQSGWYLDYVLTRSGFSAESPAWRANVERQICEASARTYLLVFLAVLLPSRRARALLDRLVTMRGDEELTAAPPAEGVVVACLHTDSFSALLLYQCLHAPNAACVVRAWMANTTLSTDQRGGGWLEAYLGRLIPAQRASAGRALIRHIRAGGLACVPFDTAPLAPDRAPTITFLGRPTLANEGPAWLAARTGAPLYLATTRYDGGQIIVEYTRVLPPAAQRHARLDVAAITDDLYRRAESLIQSAPGRWIGWTFFEQFAATAADQPLSADVSIEACAAAAVDGVRSEAGLAGERVGA